MPSPGKQELRTIENKINKIEGKGQPDPYFDQFRNTTFAEFWDRIGGPEKNGKQHPIYQYEKDVLKALAETKYVWVKKATGLGITELMLRYMAWLALKDDSYKGALFAIVTGPNWTLARDLISRLWQLFPNHPPPHTANVVTLNGVKIQSFPSNHLDSMRGQPNIKFILLDEGDFFRPGEQKNARDVSERYIAKTDPHIVLVSTPNKPDGLFEKIEKEQSSLYRKITLDYTVGLEGIYSKDDIEIARKAPGFEREYNLKYGFGIGNVFRHEDIERAIVAYNLADYQGAGCSMAIDPAFGTGEDNSKFAFIIAAKVENKIRIYHFEELSGPTYEQAISTASNIIAKYQPVTIYVDGSRPDVVKAIKRIVSERVDYENDKEHDQWWKVKPVNFGTDGRAMLGNTKALIEGGHLQIHPQFNRLIAQLRIAELQNENGNLNKKPPNTLDGLDCLRMVCNSYWYGPKKVR